MRRLRFTNPPPHRSLTREQELAQVICAAVHESGCSCEQWRKPVCSKMLWAAKRAIKFLDVAEPKP